MQVAFLDCFLYLYTLNNGHSDEVLRFISTFFVLFVIRGLLVKILANQLGNREKDTKFSKSNFYSCTYIKAQSN